jgi:hypothetical protein
MEWFYCPYCTRYFAGSLQIVLSLAAAHQCIPQWQNAGAAALQIRTVCLDCLRAPTGRCARHSIDDAARAPGSNGADAHIEIRDFEIAGARLSDPLPGDADVFVPVAPAEVNDEPGYAFSD